MIVKMVKDTSKIRRGVVKNKTTVAILYQENSSILIATINFLINKKGERKMRKIMKQAGRLNRTIIEELVELDRRTDLCPFILKHTLLNDVDDDEMEESSLHFGIVSILLGLVSMTGIWAALSMLIVILG